MTHHQVFDDIDRLTVEELENLYGLEIYDDGVVYDTAEDREFMSLLEWAQFAADQDNEEQYAHFTKRSSKTRYDDERW